MLTVRLRDVAVYCLFPPKLCAIGLIGCLPPCCRLLLKFLAQAGHFLKLLLRDSRHLRHLGGISRQRGVLAQLTRKLRILTALQLSLDRF